MNEPEQKREPQSHGLMERLVKAFMAGVFAIGVGRGLFRTRPPHAAGMKPGIEKEKDRMRELSAQAGKPQIVTPKLPAHFRIRPGWNEPRPETIPALTYVPATMAFGILLFALGLIVKWWVAVVGGLVVAKAIWGWVGDLSDE